MTATLGLAAYIVAIILCVLAALPIPEGQYKGSLFPLGVAFFVVGHLAG